MLQSDNLVDWKSIGGAVEPGTDSFQEDWWAPEVAPALDGFFIYYSRGVGDKGHQLHVARSDAPQGPFYETGVILTPDEPFAIDPHPFIDEDGKMYLYYARDFLDGQRVGTALVVDVMEDMVTPRGSPATILRASAEWQLFARNREMYGSVYDWYTLEGPFVVKRGGKYFCFFSAGSWESPHYGLSYAVADSPLGPFREPEGDGPQILGPVPGKVAGPGHACVVTGPRGNDYLVYHAWDARMTARQMCIDRLDWTAGWPVCNGPTYTPQPVP